LEHHKIKDEIINFVLNSPEETISKVAIFIAGMQAQKHLRDYRRKTGKCSFIATDGENVSIYKKMNSGNKLL
jgi:hypothetical protein